MDNTRWCPKMNVFATNQPACHTARKSAWQGFKDTKFQRANVLIVFAL